MFRFVFFALVHVRLLYVSLRRTRGLALQFSDSSDGTPSAVDNTMKVDVTVHAACDVFNTTNDVLNPSDNVVNLVDDVVNLSDDVVYPTDDAMNSSYDASSVADGSASKTDARCAAAAAAAGACNMTRHAAEPQEPMTGEGEWRMLTLFKQKRWSKLEWDVFSFPRWVNTPSFGCLRSRSESCTSTGQESNPGPSEDRQPDQRSTN